MADPVSPLQVEGINDAILSSIPDGILVIDVASKVLYLNAEGERIFARSAADLVGTPLIFDRSLRPLIALINEHRKTVPPLDRSHKQTDLDLTRADGQTVSLGVSIASVADQERSVIGYVVVCRDQTEIQMLKERARRNEAMASLGTIAAGVAHEVRNPLHAIRISCEMMNMKLPEQPVVNEYLAVITHEIERADRIIEEVLDYSRPAHLERRPTDINNAVKQYLPLLQIPSGIRVRLDLMDGLPLVPTDEFKFNQVLANLINNAKDAMAGRGELRIVTALDPGPADLLSEASQHGFVRVDITDSGPGILAEDFPRLFQVRFQSGRKRGSTGLGLSICLKIVEAHHGFITCVSPPGQGATFSVYLPTA